MSVPAAKMSQRQQNPPMAEPLRLRPLTLDGNRFKVQPRSEAAGRTASAHEKR